MSQVGKKKLFWLLQVRGADFFILQFAGGEYTYIYRNI